MLCGYSIEYILLFLSSHSAPFFLFPAGGRRGGAWMRGEMLTLGEGEDTTEGVEVAGGAGHTEVTLQDIVR